MTSPFRCNKNSESGSGVSRNTISGRTMQIFMIRDVPAGYVYRVLPQAL